MSNQSYKVRYNDQFRRFSLPYESSYYQLRKKIEDVFPDIAKGFQIYYLDEENDHISLNSQTELDEAKRLSQQIIRLMVPSPDSTKPQSQPQNTARKEEEAKPSFNPLANSSLVQSLVFVQPYLTNPTLLKTVLPFLLSEMNKNNFIPQEEITKINQMGNQLLDYPFVQDFLSAKLPKILQQITGSTPPPPPPPPAAAAASTPAAQIQDLVMPLVSMAQSFALNLSQNINSQLTPNKQETSQSSSTVPVVPSKAEPKKGAPLYHPPPKPDNTVCETYNPGVKSVVPTIPAAGQIPPASHTKYEKEVNQLKELGFTDTKFMLDLLNENDGDVYQVLEILSD